MKWRLLDLGIINPHSYKELLYFEVLEREAERIVDTILIQSPPPFIWLGTDFTPEEAINIAEAEIEGISIVETIIGGGALALDNSFIWNFIGKPSPIMPLDYAQQLLYQTQIYTLKKLGMMVKTIKNDVLVNGRKIAGGAFQTYQDVIFYDLTLNVTFNYDLAEKLLTSIGKEDKNLRTWVTSCYEELGRLVTYEELVNSLKQAIKKRFKVDLVEETLTPREQSIIRAGEQMRESFFS